MTVIMTASTGPIAPTDEVGMAEAIAAMTDAEDHEAIAEAPTIAKALATAEEALVEDLAEVDSGMEPDINNGSDWNGTVTSITLFQQHSSLVNLPRIS
jgi:hypothetical protein